VSWARPSQALTKTALGLTAANPRESNDDGMHQRLSIAKLAPTGTALIKVGFQIPYKVR
jgi:hypothetical protein